MTTWFCKLDDGEAGPLSFAELAGLAREGKVTQTTRVRRRADAPWEPAWTVVGLFADDGSPREAKLPTAEGPQADASRLGGGAAAPAWLPAAPVRRLAALEPATLLRLGLAAAFGGMWLAIVYRQAQWQALAFPARSGHAGDDLSCWFPLVGACSPLECAFFYFDLFALTSLAAWRALERFFTGDPSDDS